MGEKVLTDEEIETLLEGVDSGEVNISDETGAIGDVRNFNFDDQYDILLRRLPRINKITETLVKEVSLSMFRLLGIEAEVSLISLQTRKYGEYIRAMPDPININMLFIMPIRLPAMVVMDTRLLYILVDQYYGGHGRTQGLEEIRSISTTELRLADQLLEMVLPNMQVAWRPIADLTFNHVGTEDSPTNCQIMNPRDVVVETVIQICFNGNAGNLNVVLPYSFLEAMVTRLGGVHELEEIEIDPAWQNNLAQEVNKVTVPLSSRIEGLQLTFEELMALKPGDVVDFRMPSLVSLNVEGVPIFKGTLGSSNGHNAIRVCEKADISEIR